ncbi:MAG: glycosyltransferase [Spirochaetes bacterium]|nr:MAG: glycosyltransferase [Spirochaetota bacterium]
MTRYAKKETGISVIIPVLREAGTIVRTLDSLDERIREYDGGADILIADGDPAGSTIGALKSRGVTTLIAPRGRSLQMNAAAARARGRILLFLHADTILPPGALNDIADALADPALAGGAFDLGVDDPGPYFRIVERSSSMRSRATAIPFGDQAIFIRAALFRELGGYAPIPLMEDVEIMRRIKRRGWKILIFKKRVLTSSRMWRRHGMLRTTFRNYAIQLLYLAGVSPERLVRWYYPGRG